MTLVDFYDDRFEDVPSFEGFDVAILGPCDCGEDDCPDRVQS